MSAEWIIGLWLGLLGSVVGLSDCGLLTNHEAASVLLNGISICLRLVCSPWRPANATDHHCSR
jgi:hypothetical protein